MTWFLWKSVSAQGFHVPTQMWLRFTWSVDVHPWMISTLTWWMSRWLWIVDLYNARHPIFVAFLQWEHKIDQHVVWCNGVIPFPFGQCLISFKVDFLFQTIHCRAEITYILRKETGVTTPKCGIDMSHYRNGRWLSVPQVFVVTTIYHMPCNGIWLSVHPQPPCNGRWLRALLLVVTYSELLTTSC